MSEEIGHGRPETAATQWQRVSLVIGLDDACVVSLQAYLGQARAQSVIDLMSFIQQRLQKHQKTSFSLGSTTFGALNAAGCHQLNKACELIVALVTGRQTPSKTITSEIIADDDSLVKGNFKQMVTKLSMDDSVDAPELGDLSQIQHHQGRIQAGLSSLLSLDFQLGEKLRTAFDEENASLLSTFSQSVARLT